MISEEEYSKIIEQQTKIYESYEDKLHIPIDVFNGFKEDIQLDVLEYLIDNNKIKEFLKKETETLKIKLSDEINLNNPIFYDLKDANILRLLIDRGATIDVPHYNCGENYLIDRHDTTEDIVELYHNQGFEFKYSNVFFNENFNIILKALELQEPKWDCEVDGKPLICHYIFRFRYEEDEHALECIAGLSIFFETGGMDYLDMITNVCGYYRQTYLDVLLDHPNEQVLDFIQSRISNQLRPKKRKFERLFMDDDCAVCKDQLGNTNICITDCGHTFHSDCIPDNIEKCPICRNSL